MKLLAEIHRSETGFPKNFVDRETVRAVLMVDDDKIVLGNIKNIGYHMLPGGGIDDGEDIMSALHREAREETGYEIEILRELGKVIEWGGNRKQISYGYIVRAIGEPGPTENTEGEKNDGYEAEIFPDINSAINAVANGGNDELEYVSSNIKRDLAFLHAAIEFL